MKKSIRAVALVLLGVATLSGCGSTKVQPKVVTVNRVTPVWVPNPGHPKNFGVPQKNLKLSRPGITSSILMYDDVTISRIPFNAPAVAGYASGPFANYTTMVRAFPHAYHISIATFAGAAAQCLDVEPGDATPSQAGFWVRFDMAHGFSRPCIYANLSTMPSVKANLAATLGSTWRSRVLLWDAGWTFSPHLDFGYDATQWFGGNVIDKSQATLLFLNRGGPPPPPPGPTPKQISFWRGARNASFSQYHTRHCRLGTDKRASCNVFASRVVYFQHKLWTKYPKWHCFGPASTAKTRNSMYCWIVRPEVSHWSKARESTVRSYNRNGCGGPVSFPRPVNTPLCNTLRQRRNYYTRQIKKVFY